MKLLYSSAQIQDRIAALAAQISADYRGESILLLGVLKGCMVFLAHLLVQLKGDFEIDTMTVSSYGAGTRSGELELKMGPSRSVVGRHILLVEDIIDSGKTVRFVQDYLMKAGAARVDIATFVNKTSEGHGLAPQYIGFEYTESPFLVGFGFDLDEKYRNLPEVYQLEDSDFKEAFPQHG